MTAEGKGPLAGVKIVEFASIGPGPHCAMVLADLGADVVRINREAGNGWPNPVVDRGRANIILDIRTPEGRSRCLDICDLADVVVEGYRPGVMERLGLGPDVLLARNEGLVYGRMTGWGQGGPLAKTAGHDLTYIALTGALDAIGMPNDRSVPPLNLVGDFGGGSMFLAVGILAALLERNRSGRGQIVDAAIVDGVSHLMSMFAGLLPAALISLDRSRNILGGAAPYYRTYWCSDNRQVAVGAIEPQFWRELLLKIGVDPLEPGISQREGDWPITTARLEEIFRAHPAAHWESIFVGSDACVTPVLSLEEAMANDHLRARQSYVDVAGAPQVAPAPKLSRTPGGIRESRDGEAEIERWRTCKKTE